MTGAPWNRQATWRIRLAALTFVQVAVLAVHWRVLYGEFADDDFVNVYRPLAMGVGRFLLEPWSGHFAPIGKLHYVALHRLFGLESVYGFVLMLALHLICVGLLQLLVFELTNRLALALVLAGAFGVAPVHAGTLYWLANFAQLVVTGLLLQVLRTLLPVALGNRPARPLDGCMCAAILGLGTITFGVGYAGAVAVPLMTFLLQPRLLATRSLSLPLGLAMIAGPTVYLVFGRGPSLWSSPELSTRAAHVFLLLWAYGSSMLAAGWAFAIGVDGTARSPFGDVALPSVVAWSYALLLGLGSLVVWAFVRSEHRTRRKLVAFALLPISIYGTIALGRAALPMEPALIATQPRYEYSGLATVVVLLAFVVDAVAPRREDALGRAFGFGSFALLALAVLSARMAGYVRDEPTAKATRAAMRSVELGLRAAVERSKPGAVAYVRNQPFAPVVPLGLVGIRDVDFPGIAGFFLIAHPDRRLDGTTLRFVERNANVVDALRRQSPAVRDLLVYEGEARRQGVSIVDADVQTERPIQP